MTRDPLTSVIIPVRNGENFIADAVESVLQQIAGDDELIAVDDGSTDATANILDMVDDSRLIRLQTDGDGVSVARNKGIEAAKGRYLAFLDHDDLWPEGRHEALLRALSRTHEYSVACGVVRVRFEENAARTAGAEGLDGQFIPDLIGSALYRTDAVRAVGGFTPGMHLREDSDFQIRLVEAGYAPLRIDADTLVYRRHGANVTANEHAMAHSLLDLARRRLKRQRDRENTLN